MTLRLYVIFVIFLYISFKTVNSQEDGESFYSSHTAGALSPLGVNFEKTRIEHEVDPSRSGVNTDSIIGPIMQPIAKAFNFVAENRRTAEFANQVQDKEDDGDGRSMFDPKSILAALGRDEPRQAQSSSFMEKLLEPFVAPLKKELNKVKEEASISSLLSPLGVESNQQTDEFQMGRDKTISVLGMPLGRRDGIAFSPFKGMSYGNQDMLGPIAVNDKYNLQWDFLNKIQSMFIPTLDGKPNFGSLIQMFTQRQ